MLRGCTQSGAIETMDERLKKLVMEAQQYASQPEERQNILNQLVDEMLRSRKICRPGSQPLSGVYQEIYQQLREQLLHDVDQNLGQDNAQRTPVREWANEMRKKAFEEVLDDAQLKKLALEAQRHPPNTESRQQALIELVNAIVLSGRLCHPHRWISPNDFYALIYEEAVNQTLLYVCQKIDTYDPERGKEQKFINWVNFRLDKLVLKCYNNFRLESNAEIPTLANLEDIAQPEPQNILPEMLRQCLEEDANDLFKNEHIRNCPNANFQSIALERFSGKSWEEISADFGIRVPTLSSFFQRNCKKFAPQFKEYL